MAATFFRTTECAQSGSTCMRLASRHRLDPRPASPSTCQHSGGLWRRSDEALELELTTDKLMNYKRALVTGGAGLIGSHITDQLVAGGIDEVVILDNLTRGRLENLAASIPSGKVTVQQGDIRDRDAVRR